MSSAVQRSWTHKLQGRGQLIGGRTRHPVCTTMGRRAAAELSRWATLPLCALQAIR